MEKIKLWENGTPYFNPEYGAEEPALVPYLVKNGNKDKGMIIICPGGGYFQLSVQHEGIDVAKMLNQAGISAAVLYYRIKPYRHPAMISDANRAVRLARYHAEEWEINPEKIGILGFSAGGHLAVTACENFDDGLMNGDEIDRMSSRPNAGILCYPVVTLSPQYTHMGTREALLGAEPDPTLEWQLSGENSVPDDCPPLFIWHTAADEAVHVNNSLDLAKALKAKNVPFELHIFPKGSHGLGLAETVPQVHQWAALAVKWLKTYGF